jgi:hypothetical protein
MSDSASVLMGERLLTVCSSTRRRRYGPDAMPAIR